MAQPLPPPVGPQEVGVHGHTTVEHEEESGVGHSTATRLVDRDPPASKGLHHHQLILRQNRIVHPHTAHLRGGREGRGSNSTHLPSGTDTANEENSLTSETSQKGYFAKGLLCDSVVCSVTNVLFYCF